MTYGAKMVSYMIFHIWVAGGGNLQSSKLISPAIQKQNFMYSNLFFIAFPHTVAFSNYSSYWKMERKKKKPNENNIF